MASVLVVVDLLEKGSGYFSATAGGTHEDLQYYEL